MSLKAIFGSIAQTAASALNTVAQTQTSTLLANANGQATQAQAEEALRQMASRQAKPSVFEEQVKQISPDVMVRRNVFDKPVMVELTKPVEKMTKPEYDHAFARAVLKRAGMTDAEVSKFMNDYARVTGGVFGFTGSERELRSLHQQSGSEMRAHTSDYGLAVADAGVRQIHADRQEYAARVEQLRRDSQSYGEDALAGFYKLQPNGVVNIINDATKIVGLPELPKFEVGGEYWADKKQVGEAATTIGVALATGGATLPGDLLLIGSSAGNMAEAATGTNFRTGEELTTAERIMRGAGGAAGAYAVRGTVDDITEAVASGVKNVTKPPASVTEAVTAQGVRVPVRVADDTLMATQVEARGSRQLSGGRGVKFEEEALAKARAAHPEGFKPDAETQRLGITNRAAADYVGLQVTKSGNYIAHITEITVKNKPLSEIGKQLDGAQKIASSKMGDKITKYEFYVRTDSKELVDALAKAKNQIPRPGGSNGKPFEVRVIFEGGGKR